MRRHQRAAAMPLALFAMLIAKTQNVPHLRAL